MTAGDGVVKDWDSLKTNVDAINIIITNTTGINLTNVDSIIQANV